MSWKASGYIKELVICPNGERITITEKLLALVLADYHQVDHPTYPSVPSLAQDALLEERSVRRLLASLERKGVLAREHPKNQGKGQKTFYRFLEIDSEVSQEGGHKDPLPRHGKGGPKEDRTGLKRRTEGGPKEDRTGPLLDKQEQELKDQQEQGAQGAPAAGSLELENQATDVARAVMDDTGLAGIWIGDAIRVQAKFETRTKGIGMDDLRAVMAEAWQEYERCARDGKLRMAMMGAQKFYAEGKWRSPRLWGLKTGMKAYEG